MQKNSIVAIVVVLIIIILGVWIYRVNNNSSGMSSSNSTGNTGASSLNSNNPVVPTTPAQTSPAGGQSGQLFSASPYAQNSYLISVSTYDANTKKALSGFSVVKKVLTDGGTQYTLNAVNPEYQTQTYDVKPGEKLYFVEQNLSDDNGSTDVFPGDDHAVLVDANGYILQGP